MKKKWHVIALLFLLIVAGVLIIVRKKNSKCNIEALVVDEKWMPEGWRNDDAFAFTLLPEQVRLGAQQALYIPMDDGGYYNTAYSTVYQYPSEWSAVFHVWFHREAFFPSGDREWSELEGTRNLPLHADQWQVKCGVSNDRLLGDRCVAVLRYGAYLSVFNSSIQEDLMSIEEFTEIVLGIDELFGSCVE